VSSSPVSPTSQPALHNLEPESESDLGYTVHDDVHLYPSFASSVTSSRPLNEEDVDAGDRDTDIEKPGLGDLGSESEFESEDGSGSD
jgi:hypothetical protein